jgi:hypothetical protein
MTDEKKPIDPKPVTEDKAASAHKITRRRFTKAGAVAPIVMTLAGRPVWGEVVANGSAAASFSATSEMALSQTVTQVSSPPERWLSAALTGAWPTSTEFPGFTVASGDAFDRLFPVPSLHKCARRDVDLLRGQRLVSVLGGTIGLNEKLSQLAKQAVAAKLNALLAESLANKLRLTRDLFPMKPQAVVDGFWNAVQLDCTSISALSLTTTSAGAKPSAKSTNCTGYDQGAAMASLGGQLDDLNASGTSLL